MFGASVHDQTTDDSAPSVLMDMGIADPFSVFTSVWVPQVEQQLRTELLGLGFSDVDDDELRTAMDVNANEAGEVLLCDMMPLWGRIGHRARALHAPCRCLAQSGLCPQLARATRPTAAGFGLD